MTDYPLNARAWLTRAITFGQRLCFAKLLGSRSPLGMPEVQIQDLDDANDAISALLRSDKPCMISQFGCIEKQAFEHYLDIRSPHCAAVKWLRIFSGLAGPFWWDNGLRRNLYWIAGFFPVDDASLMRFGERVEEDCRLIDFYATWYCGDNRLKKAFFQNASVTTLGNMEPFFSSRPWTHALAGKKVLLVLPFAESARSQYSHRTNLFRDPDFLPEFDLLTYKPVVSHAGEKTPFDSWFDALDAMLHDISSLDFEIAIIGAGAYGMSLAAGIKRMGKKAFHLGGVTQLLFGIKGSRWEQSGNRYTRELFRDTWCRPLPSETPNQNRTVEGGSYW